MAQSPFLLPNGTGKAARRGLSEKIVMLDRARRRGIAVPDAHILLDDAWRFVQQQELIIRRDGMVAPRNVDEFLHALQIFHSMSDLASRVTVRPLFVRDSEHEIQQPTMVSKLRVDRRDPQALATAICAVWAAAVPLQAHVRRDVLLMSMVDAQHAGMAVSEPAYEDDLVNFTAGSGEQLARGHSAGITLTLPRVMRGEAPNASLPFAQRLQQLLRQIRVVFGDTPWELEWADDGTTCWLLHMRPMVQSPRRNERLGLGELREAISDMPSYFTSQHLRSASASVYAHWYRLDRSFTTERQLIELYAGRPRLNYSLLADMMRRWGLPGNMIGDLNDPMLATVISQPARAWRQWWRMIHIGWDTLMFPRSALKKMRTLYARARSFNGDVADAVAILHDTTVTQVYASMALARMIGPLEAWMRRRRVYAEWSGRYRSLNRAILADLAPVRVYLQKRPDIFEMLRHHTLPSDAIFAGMWEELLARYGHRGYFESDIATPRYRENPQAMIRILLDGTTALTPVKHTVMGIVAWPVWWVLSRAMYRRDAIRSAGMQVYERIRRILVKRANQAVKDGHLAHADAIWLLSPDELVRVCNGWRIPESMLLERRQLRGYQDALLVPATLMRYDDEAGWRADNGHRRVVLEGRSLSDGVVEGITWRLTQPVASIPDDIDVHQRILVIRHFDVQWIELARTCRGIILENGAELSQSASMVRMLGIPAVTAVRGAFEALPSGSVIRLVAKSGYIEILHVHGRSAPALPAPDEFPTSVTKEFIHRDRLP